MNPINLFYAEPERDRWFLFDRYPRRLIRRVLSGPDRPSGQRRVFLNLCAGLDRLGIPYRANDFRYAHSHPDELACIVGKPFMLDEYNWQNRILLGASVFPHPSEYPDLLDRHPVDAILVPGEWMRKMFEPFYGERVLAWPVGIDTESWSPRPKSDKDIDILLYDKVRWEHDRYEKELLAPIRDQLAKRDLRVAEIRYGYYEEEDFHALVGRSRAMVFVCEHETQGLAYQQVLSCNVPILAWDRGGYWQDPTYYPEIEQFGPVSSVPYWDDRCGLKFEDTRVFSARLEKFLDHLNSGSFSPREYILENLTLEKCAQDYVNIVRDVQSGIIDDVGQISRAMTVRL